MISKEKNFTKYILELIFIIIIIISIIIIEKLEKTAYATDAETTQNVSVEETKISDAKLVDLDKIIQENSKNERYKEEVVVEEEELEYITKYRNNPELYIGKTQVFQEGRNGTQAITTKKIYDENGKLIREEQVSAVVVKSSINKIIDIGTKKYEKPKDTNKNSSSGSLNFNIALNKKSGFTLEQFTKALTDDKDVNRIFQNNSKYFYYVEDEYNINGIFVAAVGIHESAWGTSRISLSKNNLFGYGAYDSNPYNGAYNFEDYAEAIDLVSRVFVKYYINPSGTSIYDGQKANGKYYSGNTLSAVNKRYASDKNWANGVYKYMQYLYNKIQKN